MVLGENKDIIQKITGPVLYPSKETALVITADKSLASRMQDRIIT
jgi:hypothetical protein